jgi:DNA-binding response OmpR family regulator
LDVVNATEVLKSSRISLHTETCQAFVGRKKVDLTITEFNLLACFLKSGGTTLSRAALLTTVWDRAYRGTSRTVDTHIQRLRSKLGKAGYLIRTVRGVGYRMEN